MRLLNKLFDIIQKGRMFRLLIEFLGLEKGPPYRLLYVIIIITGIIGYIRTIEIDPIYKIIFILFVVLISLAFIWIAINMMFPLDRRVRILVRSYAEDEDIIIFMNNNIKEWLNEIYFLFEDVGDQPVKKRKYTASQLEKMEKDLLLKGRFLEALVNETSSFLEINKESIEHLIGLNIGVNKHIIKNIIYDFKYITKYDEIIGIKVTNDVPYYEKKRKELEDDLDNKFITIKRQIKWNNQLNEHQKDIKKLIKIIKEESTGNALALLVDILKNANNTEKLIFLIKAADARAGYKLGELLGFRLKKEQFTWDDLPVDKNLEKINKYLEEFEKLRDKSIDELTDNFMKSISNEPLFCFDNIPNEEKSKFEDVLLKSNPYLTWIKDAKFEKIDDEIKSSKNDNSFSLKINDKRTRATLKINGIFCREFIVRIENGKVNLYKNNTIKIDYDHPISIALTYGYSKVLSKVFQKIIEMANREKRLNDLHIILIKSEGFKAQIRKEGKIPLRGEQQLRDELISVSQDKSLSERCNIFPIEMINERGIESQISKIFVGIESINTSGNVVHPRGETNIIKSIESQNSNVEVFAFGETYKVQVFDEYHIDYSKLSLLDGKHIDYIITDHAVHKRPDKGWNSILICCIDYWRNKINSIST